MFRCIECTLMRCETDGETCEECRANIGPGVELNPLARAAEVAALLRSAFVWSESLAGPKYWEDICKKLNGLASGEGWKGTLKKATIADETSELAMSMHIANSETCKRIAKLAAKLQYAFFWNTTEYEMLFSEAYRILMDLANGIGWKNGVPK